MMSDEQIKQFTEEIIILGQHINDAGWSCVNCTGTRVWPEQYTMFDRRYTLGYCETCATKEILIRGR